MEADNNVKLKKPKKDKSKEAKEFAKQYMKNVTENQIKVMCPECNMNTTIYPEHLGRSYCEKCNVLLQKVEDSKTDDKRKLISTHKGCKIFQENQNNEDGLVAFDSEGNIVAWRFGIDSNDLNQIMRDIEHFNQTGDSKTKDEELKKGDLVRLRRVVDPDDDKIVMRLLENPDGGRVLVESLIWDALNPTRVLPTSELIKDSETKDVIKNKK
jgi:ribosomal protein S27E